MRQRCALLTCDPSHCTNIRIVHPSTDSEQNSTSAPLQDRESSPSKSDSNILLECLSCNRQVRSSSHTVQSCTDLWPKIASNRYAAHLSSCLGLGSARRAGVRSINSKSVIVSQVSSCRSSSTDPVTLTALALQRWARMQVARTALLHRRARASRKANTQVPCHCCFQHLHLLTTVKLQMTAKRSSHTQGSPAVTDAPLADFAKHSYPGIARQARATLGERTLACPVSPARELSRVVCRAGWRCCDVTHITLVLTRGRRDVFRATVRDTQSACRTQDWSAVCRICEPTEIAVATTCRRRLPERYVPQHESCVIGAQLRCPDDEADETDSATDSGDSS
jgi:hypothetical protein